MAGGKVRTALVAVPALCALALGVELTLSAASATAGPAKAGVVHAHVVAGVHAGSTATSSQKTVDPNCVNIAASAAEQAKLEAFSAAHPNGHYVLSTHEGDPTNPDGSPACPDWKGTQLVP